MRYATPINYMRMRILHGREARPKRSEDTVHGDPMAAAPENATSLLPSEARSLFRLNEYHGSTAGFCSGYLQASVTILPSAMTDNFHEFCRRNYAALPLLYRSKPGELNSELATDSDIRSVHQVR